MFVLNYFVGSVWTSSIKYALPYVSYLVVLKYLATEILIYFMFQNVAVSVAQNLVFCFFFLVEFLKDYFLSVSLSPSLCLFFPLSFLSQKPIIVFTFRDSFFGFCLFVGCTGSLLLCLDSLLRLAGSGAHGLSSSGAQASLIVVHGFSCLEACGPRD